MVRLDVTHERRGAIALSNGGVARNDACSRENICPFREADVRLPSATQGFFSAIVRDRAVNAANPAAPYLVGSAQRRRVRRRPRQEGSARGHSSPVWPVCRERLTSCGEAWFQRRKAWRKFAVSLKPKACAISSIVICVSRRYFIATSARNWSKRSRNEVSSSRNLRRSVRTGTPRCARRDPGSYVVPMSRAERSAPFPRRRSRFCNRSCRSSQRASD